MKTSDRIPCMWSYYCNAWSTIGQRRGTGQTHMAQSGMNPLSQYLDGLRPCMS